MISEVCRTRIRAGTPSAFGIKGSIVVWLSHRCPDLTGCKWDEIVVRVDGRSGAQLTYEIELADKCYGNDAVRQG